MNQMIHTIGAVDRPNRRPTAAEALAKALRRHGVELTFGQSIPSAFHLAAAQVGLRQIAYRAENAGGAMADGYARISGKVAVVTAQNGPAATLLVPPLAEALKASVPVVALVQDVARDAVDRNAFQEIDHPGLFAPVAKWVRRVERAERLGDYVDMAFAAAASGRPGPAVLLLPYDLLNDAVEESGAQRSASLGQFPLDRLVPTAEAVDKAARALAAARLPIVVAGGGVHLSGAAEALARLQEEFAIPVATTTMGKGAVAETHPLSLGVAGYVMGPRGMARHLAGLIEEADLVFFIGTRTNQNGTDSWRLFRRAPHVIHLDADPLEIGRNYEATRLVGDAKATLECLIAAMRGLGPSAGPSRRPALERRIAEARRQHAIEAQDVVDSDAAPLRPERIMRELQARLRPSDIVVADASYSTIWVANYLRALAPGQRFITPRGLAGLGWGLPLALGAQLARPDSRVICVAGDGGFAHCWAELETAVRHALPVTTIVLNNGILGLQKHAELVKFGAHTDAIDFRPVDHAAIARACGCAAFSVTSAAALGPALDAALNARGPVLIDAATAPDAYPPISFFEGAIEQHV
jgi:acetolactate synthase-1/2/3 large subunit